MVKRGAKKKPVRKVILTVGVYPAEKEDLKRKAEALNLELPAYLRMSILGYEYQAEPEHISQSEFDGGERS